MKSSLSNGVMSEPRTADDVQDWIVEYLSEQLQVAPHAIDTRASFDSFAIDSATAIGMTGELEEWLDRDVDPTLVYDYPTIEEFSEYLVQGGA